ncbi:MAG: hypothetical protein Q4F84_05560 [Fibrobacter sp.]|nr:hypothetical protein [Fibrobacter sp.]
MNLEVKKQLENWYSTHIIIPAGTRLHKVYWRRPDGYEGIVESVPEALPDGCTLKAGDWVLLTEKDLKSCQKLEVEE